MISQTVTQEEEYAVLYRKKEKTLSIQTAPLPSPAELPAW